MTKPVDSMRFRCDEIEILILADASTPPHQDTLAERMMRASSIAPAVPLRPSTTRTPVTAIAANSGESAVDDVPHSIHRAVNNNSLCNASRHPSCRPSLFVTPPSTMIETPGRQWKRPPADAKSGSVRPEYSIEDAFLGLLFREGKE